MSLKEGYKIEYTNLARTILISSFIPGQARLCKGPLPLEMSDSEFENVGFLEFAVFRIL